MRSLKPLAVLAVVFFVAARCAFADTLTFGYSVSFGAVPPVGPAPWATAVFDDGGSPGTVTLTMSVAGTVGAAAIKETYFNLNPELNSSLPLPASAFTFNSGLSTGPQATAIVTGVDAYKADGDGKYDILFNFPTSGDRFSASETVVYKIELAGLTTSSSNFFSKPAGGNGPFLSVAKFYSTGSGAGSDWVAGTPVPEPTNVISVVAMVVAAAVFLGMKRHRETSVETHL